jgi:FixJ family two-component response regulator
MRIFAIRLDVCCDPLDNFLKSECPNTPACLVLDIRLPGKSGLDFQRELATANIHLPIVFITGHGDIPMTVQAMKGGAIEFLTKPFRDQDLLDAIQLGLERDRSRRKNEMALADLRARFETLSPREREIIVQVVRGRLSKVHRSNLTRKMRARSLSELTRMAGQA